MTALNTMSLMEEVPEASSAQKTLKFSPKKTSSAVHMQELHCLLLSTPGQEQKVN